MKKKIYPITCCIIALIISIPSYSQSKANARFLFFDKSTNEVIENATVTWSSLRSNKKQGSGVTDAKGEVYLTCEIGSEIVLSAYFIGYKTYIDTVVVKKEQIIKLAPTYQNLNEVVVTGKSKEQRLRESPEAVSVIDGKELYGRAVSLESVLNKSVGLSVLRTGGVGSASRIMIHGLEGNRIQLLVDGMPYNTDDGTFSIDDIPIELIDRIEVYKSIIPARFGADGLGGAINIITKEFTTDYIDATAQAGSFGTKYVSTILRKNIPEKGILLGAGAYYNYADNDYYFKVPERENLRVKRDHDLYKSYLIKGSVKFTKLWFDEISVEMGYNHIFDEVQGILANIQHAEGTTKNISLENKFRRKSFFSDKLDFELHSVIHKTNVNFIDTSSVNYDFEGNTYPSPNKYGETGDMPHNSRDKTLDIQERMNLDFHLTQSHSLNFNTLFRYTKKQPKDDLASEYAGYAIGGYPSKMQNLVSGLTLDSRFLDGRLHNMFSVKHFYLHSEIEPLSLQIQGTPEIRKNSSHNFGFIEAIKFEVVNGLNLKASYQRAVRLPKPDELFGDGIIVFPANSLNPEKSHNLNLGAIYDKSAFLGLHRIQFEVSGFYMRINDMIKLMQQYRQMGYENISEVETKGIEGELKIDINKNVFLYGNLTYQDVRDVLEYEPGTIALNPTKGLRLPNIPYLFSNFGMEYHNDKLLGKDWYFKAYWDGRFTEKFFYSWQVSSKQNRSIPRSFVNDLGFLISYKNSYSVSVECHNISNNEVWNLYRTPLAGRSFHIKFRYTLSNKF